MTNLFVNENQPSLPESKMHASSSLLSLSISPELFTLKGFDCFPDVNLVITGRNGGFSSGICSSLNLSYNGVDLHENVLKNRKKIFSFLNRDPSQIFFQSQVHKDGISMVKEKWEDITALEKEAYIPANDAMITLEKDTVLIARGADCPLIALYDAQYPAVAIIHAGWRSTLLEITAKTVKKLLSITGSDTQNLYAGFSPSAGPCCYEIGDDLRKKIDESPGANADHCIKKTSLRGSDKITKYYLDLWRANTWQLLQNKIPKKNIYNAEICTICNNNHFFSYRVQGENVGNQGMLIWLDPSKNGNN